MARYDVGMSGNQDRARRAAARLDASYDEFCTMLDKAKVSMRLVELQEGDVLAVQRYVRGVDLLAKTERTLASLQPAVEPARQPRTEDGMSDNERDDSPEALDRVRAELESRLDSLRATIEAKRLVGWTVVRAALPGAGEHAPPA